MTQTVEEDTLAVVVKASKMTKDVFLEAVQNVLKEMKSHKSVSGKQSLNQLIKDGSTLQNIEVTEKNIKSFEQSARAFGIDYALKKLPDKNNPTYVVFFKGKNAEQVQRAFKDYAYKCTHNRDKPSVQKEIDELNKAQSLDKNRQRTRENIKERGMQL